MVNEPTYKVYEPGDVIFNEGDIGDCAFFIEDGQVEIFLDRDGKNHTLAVLGENEIFGEMAIIGKLPRSAGARALTKCSLGIVQKEQLSDRMREADPVIAMIIRVLIQRLRREVIGPQAEERRKKQSPEEQRRRLKVIRSTTDEEEKYALGKIKMEAMLRNAIPNNEMEMHYQPIVHLRSGRVAGFEALLRWNNPASGLVYPDSFINVCEETNLIIPIGRWVLDAACQGLAKIQKRVNLSSVAALPFVSINVSGRQIQDTEFFDHLERARKSAGLKPQQIKLEITEQIFVQGQTALEWAEKAHFLGYTLALDDFGTGYSSFQYLGMFPLDFIKIDRSFIMKMLEEEKSLVIARAIVNLGQNFDIPVIAEGVEDAAHAQNLISMGCEFGQGYYFSRPHSVEDTIKKYHQKKSSSAA